MSRPRAPRAASDSIAARARQTGASGPKGAESPPLPELRPGQSVELLKELHILTREGKLNQDSRRKLKQVGHLVVMSRDVVLAPARNDTVPIQEVSVQTACH